MSTATAVYTGDRLQALYDELIRLCGLIDDEESVPERYDSTGKSFLAEMDAEVLRLAALVVQRLMLWARFTQASPEAYWR